MKVTSSQAAKILRALTNELNDLIRLENKACTFIAAVGEDLESVRPAYSFEDTRAKEKELSEKIRKLKHAINIFNTTTKVPGFDMTIDEVLVCLPQMTAAVSRLSNMKSVLPKERVESYGRQNVGLIDYQYANYDIDKAAQEYIQAADTLAKLQLALDTVNTTVEFEIEI
jgi:predicted translin family RNA/ssDNA-binding protein